MAEVLVYYIVDLDPEAWFWRSATTAKKDDWTPPLAGLARLFTSEFSTRKLADPKWHGEGEPLYLQNTLELHLYPSLLQVEVVSCKVIALNCHCLARRSDTLRAMKPKRAAIRPSHI